jgi:hypothetical protein
MKPKIQEEIAAALVKTVFSLHQTRFTRVFLLDFYVFKFHKTTHHGNFKRYA